MRKPRILLTLSVLTVMAVTTSAIGVGVALFIWAHGASSEAEATDDAVEFSLAIGGCDTTGGDVKCSVQENSDFDIFVSLDSFSGIGNETYGALSVTVDYDGAVSSNGRLSLLLWPDCYFHADAFGPGYENAGCARGVGEPSSTYTGVVATGSFHCGEGEGTLSLRHGYGLGTLLIDSKETIFIDKGSDSITVNCEVAAPTLLSVANLGQYVLPKTCFDVRDDLQNSLFVVCDNNFQGPPAGHPVCVTDGVCEDEDPAEGLIAVSVSADAYSVQESKAAPNHAADTGKLSCDASSGQCQVTFVNTPNTRPWHPWDVDGDGLVRVDDIVAVVNHYFDDKVTPTPTATPSP